MKIYDSIEQLIGKTPLLRLKSLEKEYSLRAKLIVKIEKFNPVGSSKDRAVLYMLDDAENKGLIKSGATIIEPTSGNTGIALAGIGSARGYKVVLTMPDSMSVERRNLLKGLGATVVLTEGELGMSGAIEKAKQIQAKTPNSFILSQFDNKANSLAHYKTTAPEIWEDTDGEVDILVCGIGTGGTFSGTAKYLKEKKPNLLAIAVEPSASPMISEGVSGKHKIQGIGANFIPKNFDRSLCDFVFAVDDADAINCAKMLAKTQGLSVGISSGAALFAAIELAKKQENSGKTIVAILPDGGERYLSTELFN